MDHIDDFKNIDAIITDPPFLQKYLDLYEDLARFSAQVLRPGGSLLAMADIQLSAGDFRFDDAAPDLPVGSDITRRVRRRIKNQKVIYHGRLFYGL